MNTAPPISRIVQVARRASSHAGDTGSLRRHEAAEDVLRLPPITVSEHGAGRAAIARALRSCVVARALVRDTGARGCVAVTTRELANGLLSEPEPPPPNIWWVGD
jgi:hypothetical protein